MSLEPYLSERKTNTPKSFPLVDFAFEITNTHILVIIFKICETLNSKGTMFFTQNWNIGPCVSLVCTVCTVTTC